MSTSSLTSKVLKVPLEKIAKSIVMVDNFGNPLMVILPGNCKIKTKRIKEIFGLKDVRLAFPEEVKKFTNYEVGEVPPVFHGIERTIVDIKLLKNKIVFAGGGTKNAIIEMRIEDIIKLNKAKIGEVSK